jgi:prevent-host-death family protein
MYNMDPIPDELAVSEARANLTEVVNAVRLQDRMVQLTRRGAPQAVIVPVDIAEAITEAGGLDRARTLLKEGR